jgi:hypothetical protein
MAAVVTRLMGPRRERATARARKRDLNPRLWKIGKKLPQHKQCVGGAVGGAQLGPMANIGYDELSDGFGASPKIEKIAGLQHAVLGARGCAEAYFLRRESSKRRALSDADHDPFSRGLPRPTRG